VTIARTFIRPLQVGHSSTVSKKRIAPPPELRGRAERVDHREVERVALLRSVDADEEEVAVLLGGDSVGHRGASRA